MPIAVESLCLVMRKADCARNSHFKKGKPEEET